MTTPSHLTKDQKRLFKNIVKALITAGTIADANPAMVEGLAVAIARGREADQLLETDGLTMTTRTGYMQQHPAVAISSNAWKLVKVYCDSLGMSPQARAKLSATANSDAQSALDDLLSD